MVLPKAEADLIRLARFLAVHSPSGRAVSLSTIWLTVWLSMGKPVAGEEGTPTRAHSRRR